MTGIFDSTEQALHVSFLIVSMPARQKNTFRMALIQALESVGRLSDRQESFLAYLRGEKSGTVDFSGLSADEVRAQCAMVVAAVSDQLPEPERNALWIRFARGIPARPKSATVAADPGVPPSSEWRRGVFGLANEMRAALTINRREAIIALIAAHAFPHQREKDFSYANLSKEFGIPVRTLERAAFTIRKRLRLLERQAVDRLQPLFERGGVVSAEECLETA
ncbi:hypothetical protein [Caballeronia sp. AZ10_KS36]|uniref:hypothetical protein n=1 Tax=Caballeronia sp. AZ10_KS36 TaxID=2921757 RepID=UPI0020281940|nr:hypothetical protein [Caballeronia sp. AZ10_KS36]